MTDFTDKMKEVPESFVCGFMCPYCGNFIEAKSIEYSIDCENCNQEFWITIESCKKVDGGDEEKI